jgi:hypothetical protein
VSDIDIAVVDSLKCLTPNGRLEKQTQHDEATGDARRERESTVSGGRTVELVWNVLVGFEPSHAPMPP